MRNALALFCILLLLVSCNKEKSQSKVGNITQNQRQIAKWYLYRYDVANLSVDTITLYADKIEKAAANEPAAYQAMAAMLRGTAYGNSSSYELAFKNYEKGLQLAKKSKVDTLVAVGLLGVGNYYKNTGNFPKALDYFYKSLKIYEQINSKIGIAYAHAHIGEVFQQRNDIDAAIENLKIALKTLEHNKSNHIYLYAAHNLANVIGMSGDFKGALAIDEEGIRITDSLHSPRLKSTFLDNKAHCYMFTNRIDSAKYYFTECLKIDIASGNKKQIADSYSNLANLAMYQKDYPTAEDNIFKSINLLKQIKNRHNLAKSYDILADIYQSQGEFKKAFNAHKMFYDEWKLLIDEKKEAALAEYKIVYDTQKKEKQLAENKVLLLQNEADSKQKTTTIVMLSLLILFLGVVGVLIQRQQRFQSNQREQEFQLKTAISQIETQNKLQQQRLSISRDLHDNIGAQLTFIISSVDTVKYGFDVEYTKLGNRLDTISDFTKSTIIELRDTIWAMNNNEISFEDLRARIFNFIEKAKIAKEDIQFKFNIDDNLDDIKLSSIQGINIYRTIQEAVNNTIKYAKATEISIDVKRNNAKIEIEINDNGIGFDYKNTNGGNGLINMRKRIDDIGGKFTLESNKTGTKIAIEVPENYNID
ncbi:MAG: sensor histidine kinase [Flavobacterium sp.]|nr:sensor histidine kinase [Flavobacterium sp.]